MRRKTFALLLLALMFVSPTVSAPISVTNADITAADQIISFLEQPDLIVTMDVKRVLNETAPDLLNNAPVSIEKLKKIMKDISSETGIDPYNVDKIMLAIRLAKNRPEAPVFTLQTTGEANPFIENFYQHSVDEAKLNLTRNPARNRVAALNIKLTENLPVVNEEMLANQPKRLEDFTAKLQTIKSNMTKAKSPISPVTSQAVATIEKSLALFKTDSDMTEDLTQVQKIQKDLNDLKSNDSQNTSKIAALDQQISQTEKALALRFRNRLVISRYLQYSEDLSINATLDEAANLSEKLLTETPAQKARTAKTIGQKLTDFQFEMNRRLDGATEETDAEQTLPTPTYPLYNKVIRRDETIGSQKVLTIITETKHNGEKGEAYPLDSSQEDSIALLDEHTILMSSRTELIKILENKSNRVAKNQRLKNLLDNTSGSLISFAADSHNIDLSEISGLLNSQNHVLQFFGSISSQNKEVSLTASIEKTDELMPRREKEGDAGTTPKPALPALENSSAASDLFRLIAKTLVGVEGKITLKFDKKKVAKLVRETPQILGSLIKDTSGNKESGKLSR